MFALYPTTVQQFKLQRYKEFSKQLTQVGQHFKNENNKYKKYYGHPRSFFVGELSELHEGHPRLYKMKTRSTRNTMLSSTMFQTTGTKFLHK